MDDQNDQVNNVANTRAAEYAILYDVTPDGRFQLRGFHENSYDLYDGEIARAGWPSCSRGNSDGRQGKPAHEEARKRNEGAPRPDDDEQDPGKRERTNDAAGSIPTPLPAGRAASSLPGLRFATEEKPLLTGARGGGER